MRYQAFAAAGAALMGIVLFGGCGVIQGHETAIHALRVFCAANNAELTAILLTPEQRRAAQVVCHAIGMRAGTG